ncbi:hypothetical protein [Mesorhizobium kowhaii]|uniref:hypothetical protein n=1 Tax=Mesorhizobium kowhaii TaxID=1300272 RepID=UPI0011B48E84|nr:hypothetical protein [Mesorhizobium kowhaii]
MTAAKPLARCGTVQGARERLRDRRATQPVVTRSSGSHDSYDWSAECSHDSRVSRLRFVLQALDARSQCLAP